MKQVARSVRTPMNPSRVRFLLVASLFLANPSYGQWVETNGPYGQSVYSLEVASSGSGTGVNILAGTDGGIFRSTNHGASWVRIGLAERGVLAVAAGSGSSAVLVTGTDIGIFRSTNEGSSWSDAGPANRVILALAADPVIAGILFAGTEDGVLLSTDEGATWKAAGMEGKNVLALRAMPADGEGGIALYAGTDDGVSISNDRGATWREAGLPGMQITALTAGRLNTSGARSLFAGSYDGSVFRSTNRGIAWVKTDLQSSGVNALAFSPDSSGTLFAGTNGGVVRSRDEGASWMAVGNGGNDIITLAVDTLESAGHGSRIFAGAFSRGIFLSTDNGSHWEGSGLASRNILSLAICPSETSIPGGELIAGTYGGIFASPNRGRDWFARSRGLTCDWIYSLLATPGDSGVRGNLYAGTLNGIFRSSDNGLHWIVADSGLTNKYIRSLAVCPRDTTGSEILFAGTSGAGVSRSTDDGKSWLAGGPANEYIHALAVGDPGRGATGAPILAGSLLGDIFISSDRGASWVKSGSTGETVNAIAMSSDKYYAGTMGGVFCSSDAGRNWTNIGLTDRHVYALTIAGYALVAGTDAGVYYAKTNVPDWIATGLARYTVRALAIIPEEGGSDMTLYAGTDNSGVWRRTLSELTPVEYEATLPESFALLKSHPTPFRDRTTVSFQIPSSALVRLRVFDNLGREVAVLVDGEREAGRYEIPFDGSRLPGGIYYLRLEAKGMVTIGKVCLLK